MDEIIFMLVDPNTNEALRVGEGPAAEPCFFSSRERAETHAREIERPELVPYALPAGVLARMRRRPHLLDGIPQR